MTWHGEASNLSGVISLFLLSVLAVTSLPSVAESLNWSEWVLVQSRLGYVTLLLSLGHVAVVAKLWLR